VGTRAIKANVLESPLCGVCSRSPSAFLVSAEPTYAIMIAFNHKSHIVSPLASVWGILKLANQYDIEIGVHVMLGLRFS